MADKKEPVLSLDTLVEHRCVVIDGVAYDLVNVSEISILDYHRLGKRAARVEQLMNGDELDESQVAELCDHMAWICAFVLCAPEEILRKLSDNQRLAVMQAFIELQRGETLPAAPAGATETPAPSPEAAPPTTDPNPSTGAS